jgi:uncharacterized membrane protein YhaH (DUF805 family)
MHSPDLAALWLYIVFTGLIVVIAVVSAWETIKWYVKRWRDRRPPR